MMFAKNPLDSCAFTKDISNTRTIEAQLFLLQKVNTQLQHKCHLWKKICPSFVLQWGNFEKSCKYGMPIISLQSKPIC